MSNPGGRPPSDGEKVAIMLDFVRRYEQEHGYLPDALETAQAADVTRGSLTYWMAYEPELRRLLLPNRIDDLRKRTGVNWFTMSMAHEFLKDNGISISENTIGQLCHGGEFPGAVKRWRMWLVPLEELEAFTSDYPTRRAATREKRRRLMLDYWTEHRGLRPSRICTRCEIVENVGPDGLCPQCREELTGAYRWYPLPSRLMMGTEAKLGY